MPRKARMLASYPKHYFAFFEGAARQPLHLPTANLKESQYIVAELNHFRVSLRSALHPFYQTAERVVISARENEVFMRTQEAEWAEFAKLLPQETLDAAERMVNELRQEEEEKDRQQLNAPKPSSPFEEAMEMLTKKDQDK